MGMRHEHAIFLSAGIPDPSAPHFMGEADSAAISALVSALLFVALGRRQLVWGGHPAITPMIWAYAEGLGVEYGQWVTLYQSAHFKDDFPEESARFANVVVTASIPHDRERSLEQMRRQMIAENSFDAAIFAGGMGGIFDEYRILKELAPRAKIVPFASTGGAAATLARELNVVGEVSDELDYVSYLFEKLSIAPDEPRGEAKGRHSY